MSDTCVVHGHVPCGKLATVFAGGTVAAVQQMADAQGLSGCGHRCKGLPSKQLEVFLETVRHGTEIALANSSSAIGFGV